MSDITMCPGTDCPMKQSCRRFTARSNDHWQSYFLDPPYHINDGGFSCDMYWGATADSIMETLQDAMGIRIINLNDVPRDFDARDHSL